jgi:hypothetical protein
VSPIGLVIFDTVHILKGGKGIEAEIGKRYNRYAIIDNLVSIAVYADYEKYKKMLADKNLRKHVPIFDINDAERYLDGRGVKWA